MNTTGQMVPIDEHQKSYAFYRNPFFWFMIVSLVTAECLCIIFYVIPKNSISISNQSGLPNILVDRVVLTKPGFVAIATSNDLNKPSGQLIAHSDYLVPDTYINLQLIYFIDFSAKKNTEAPRGEKLFVIVFEDSNQSHHFDSADRVMRDIFGRPMIKPFRVL